MTTNDRCAAAGDSQPLADVPVSDPVDEIAVAWQRELPGAPVASIGVITRIWRIAKLLDDDRRATMVSVGMDVPTRNLLSTLRRGGKPYALAAAELARRAGVTAGAVSQWVGPAERAGLVTRRRDGADGRSVTIALTARGKRRIDAAVGDLLAHEATLVDAFTADEVDELAALLRRLLGDLERRRLQRQPDSSSKSSSASTRSQRSRQSAQR